MLWEFSPAAVVSFMVRDDCCFCEGGTQKKV